MKKSPYAVGAEGKTCLSSSIPFCITMLTPSSSGKSSIILLLLRLLDPIPSCHTHISIDDIPLHEIDRSTLRQRIIAVPQEAVFLPDGTSFMSNLDPLGISTELECRAVLEAVSLWGMVAERGGLGGGMAADTLSQGQKQLFILARAILRSRARGRDPRGSSLGAFSRDGGGILLLDEFSSSVDLATDRSMQKLIAEEFAGYTIVMVSHRLDVVMDFDTVVVMDQGRLVETGRPRVLAKQSGSWFQGLTLVRESTGNMSGLLTLSD